MICLPFEKMADRKVALLLHGEPTWSYLYRNMIPILVKNGIRVIAPDFIGFGKSDKPSDRGSYSYNGHVEWINIFFRKLNFRGFREKIGFAFYGRCGAVDSVKIVSRGSPTISSPPGEPHYENFFFEHFLGLFEAFS